MGLTVPLPNSVCAARGRSSRSPLSGLGAMAERVMTGAK